MGEKLNAFLSFYSTKAKEEVEKWKAKTAEDEVKWKKLTDELYPAALKTATDFKQLETFQQVFPSPGTYVENVTKYGSMLGTDPGFEKQLKELYKWRNTKTQIANRKQYLVQAEEYVSKGGEDYISRLSHEIFSKTAEFASRGAKFDTIIDQLFKSYEGYTEFLEDLIDNVPGPDGVLTSAETYAALLEKKEGGAFTSGKKSEEAKPSVGSEQKPATSSPINPPTEKKEESGKAASSSINEPGKKSADSTVSSDANVTSKKTEVSAEKPKVEPKKESAININLENKKVSEKTEVPASPSTSAPKQATVSPASTVTKNTINTPSESTVKSTTNSPSTLTIQNTVNAPTSQSKLSINNTTNQPLSTGDTSTSQSMSTVSSSTSKPTSTVNAPSSTTSTQTTNTKESTATSSSTVNVEQPKVSAKLPESDGPKKEKGKGKFLTGLGKLAKAAGSALNLPTIGDLKEQASGLLGVSGTNIKSRVSEISDSFKKEKSEISSSVNAKVSMPTFPQLKKTENLTSSQNQMSVEQQKPSVSAAAPITAAQAMPQPSAQMSPGQTGTVSNTSTQNISQSTQLSQSSPQVSPSAPGQSASPQSSSVNVDNSQLAQAISRLERILVSGIEVTVKDTV